MNGIFDQSPWERQKAIKALHAAKILEEEKMKAGARYVQENDKTWRLKIKRGRS